MVEVDIFLRFQFQPRPLRETILRCTEIECAAGAGCCTRENTKDSRNSTSFAITAQEFIFGKTTRRSLPRGLLHQRQEAIIPAPPVPNPNAILCSYNTPRKPPT